MRLGNAHPNISPYEVIPAADGYLILAVGNDGQFRRLCTILGLDGIGEDERFATNKARVANRDEVRRLVSGKTLNWQKADLLKACEDNAVPAGAINTIEEMFADPQVIARGIQIALSRPDGAVTPGVANPIRLSATPIDYDRAPPALGDGTATVLKTVLGLAEGDVEALRDSGVIG